MIPAPARPFFVAGGFDPAAYPGFKAYWLADDAVVGGGSVVSSVPVSQGTLGSLVGYGSPIYTANGWPVGAAPAVEFSNADARALSSTTGFDASADFDMFVVFSADSAVAGADLQWLAFLGTFGDIFGVAHVRSFDSENWVYRQDVGWVTNAVDALAGPQVWAVRYRSADPSPNLKVWRSGALSMSGDISSFPVDAFTVGGLLVGGVPAGPGTQLNGLWKAAILYQGSAMTEVQDLEISAELTTLFL